jgi:hypothetical protein
MAGGGAGAIIPARVAAPRRRHGNVTPSLRGLAVRPDTVHLRSEHTVIGGSKLDSATYDDLLEWLAGSAWSGRWRTGSRRDAGSGARVQADRSKWAFAPEPAESANRQIDLSVSIRASETVLGRNDFCRQTRPPPFSASAPEWRRRHDGKGSRTPGGSDAAVHMPTRSAERQRSTAHKTTNDTAIGWHALAT